MSQLAANLARHLSYKLFRGASATARHALFCHHFNGCGPARSLRFLRNLPTLSAAQAVRHAEKIRARYRWWQSRHTAKKKENQANTAKRELIAGLSHDIKAPVASIKAVSEVLLATSEDEKLKSKYTIIN